MTKSYKFDNTENILFCIDKSIKKVREIENRKFPYAVIINPINGRLINFDNFTYLPKNGFKSIPIIKNTNVDEKEIQLAYSEPELIELINLGNF